MRRYPFVRRGLLASAIALTLFGLFLIPFALASAPQVADAPTPSSPEQAVQTAWQRAQQAGAYRFTTRVVQTTHPAPAIANVGTGSRVETVYLEGDADLPAETLLLHLWQDGGRITDASSGVEVRIEGDRAYGRAASGEWQEMDNVAGSFAPNNDLLAYLAGVKNVREISDFGFQISDAAPDSQSAIRNPQSAIRQYVFDLDGPAFANHVRAQLEERLRSTGELPAGLQLDTPDSLRRAVGKGEVWIDGDSLPLRLTMHIEYPQQRNGERVEADIQTDFSNFPRQMLAQADSRSFQQNFGSLLRDGASAASQAGVGLTLLGLMLGMVIHRRSRKVYAVVVWVIILAMVIAPLLQSQQVYAWGQKQSARQVESEQRQGAQEAERQYQQEMSGASWDPQRDPLANGQMANQQMGKWANQQINNTQYAVRNPQSAIRNLQSSVPQATPEPTSDDDGDGLTYAQEIRLGADPNEADTDGDRITDKAEVAGFFYNNRWWYSDPKSPDTNNDGQLDTLECWAKVVDPDAGEISPNETVACKDSDGDGTPDLFDRDDDGDGVPDAVDLSPYDFNNNGGRLFDADHPLLLQVDGLQAGKPAFVDFQLRPENADHLWYALNVLDWPSGDEDGQIQRKAGNDSTFEDVAVKGDPVAANAGNGDMRLIPMLEIKMTGDTFPLKFTTPEIAVGFKGAITATVHFGQAGNNIALDFSLDSGGVYDVTINERACQNLGDDLVTFPGLSDGASRTILNQKLTGLADGKHGLVLTGAGDKFCLDIGNVVNGPFADQMVDRKPLDPYGITVREGDDDGTLLAYSPLNLVADETGSDRTAFAGRMAYRPTTDQWGDTQKVNVVWVIQMLTDHRCNQAEEFAGRCTEDEWVLDTLQIVRAYPETWYLTGMAAREDHGVDIAVVYEDPAQEAAKNRQYDDQLWNLAWGLDKSFLTGRDQNGDGQRDITTAEIHARWDYPTNQNNGYANGDDKLWGVPITATRVVTFAYDLQDQYIHLAMTETKKILNDAFLDYVNAGSDAPTLLFTQESRYRSSDLGDDATTTEAVSDTVKVTLDLDPAKSQEETQVSMSWAPYRYEAGEWKSYPIDEYWDKIEVRYEEVFDEYQDDPAYEDIRRGQVFIAKMFYLAMYHGSSALVQVGDDLVGYQGSVYTDVDLEELLAAVDEAGGVTVRVTKALANVFAGMVGGVFEEVDLRAFLAGVHKIDPNGTYSTLFKHYRSEVNKGHLKDGAVAMLTAAVMAGYILAEALDIEPLTHALNVSVAFFSLYTLASAGVALYKTGKAVVPIAKAVAIGFLITELVTWGLFAYQLFASGLKPGSMAANFIFATEVAATITGLIMLAIAAIPIVGQIIAAVIGLFDSIVLTVCGLAHSEHPVCQGISGWMVYGIRWVIYSGAIMVNLDDDERLKIHEFSQDFLDSALGMAVGNSLVMEATIRNRIELIDWKDTQSNWMAGLYWWQYSDDTLRSSTFVYHLDAVARDYHERLARNSIRHDEWTPDTDGAKSYTYSADVSAQTRLTEDGINLGIPLYLNEGFAVPAQECWLIPIWFPPFAIPVCYIRTEKASSNINLGEHMRFDIFPPTLDGFYELTTQNGGYALAWSQDTSPAFPRLKDADGDGLRDKADGGADPNDLKWDTDGDGLSDFYEVQIGTNPQVADTDHDGLTDYQEVILGTDPLRADSDYDGLTDGEEVAGWEFVYDFTADGSQLKTWVTSDPLSIDGDGDTLTDFQEKTFGFNPRVPSDLNVLTFSSEVTEQKAPRLLLRLDELDGANAFRDDSGYAHNAACPPSPLAGGTEGGCPLAGHQGKYGNAPQFDGSNDYLEVAHTDRLNPDRELTLAAWVQLDHPGNNQKIVGKTTTGNGYLLGVAGGQLSPEIWDSQGARTAAQWGSIPAGTWTHIAVTWRSGGKMTGYVNGNRVGDIAASANPIKANTGPLRIGIAPWNATAFPAGGRIDEVVMIPRELTQAEIVSLAAGRHNPEDLTVRPGDVLDYRATVTNKLFNRYAQGLLSANFPAVFSEPSPQAFVLNPQEASTLTGEVHTGQAAASGVYTLTQEADALITDWREASNYADMLLHLDEAAGATTFEDSAGAQPPRDGACDSGAGQCPTAGEPGRSGYALHFDGVNDLVAVKNANTDNPQVLTIAAWVYPDTLPSRVMRFVSLNGEKAVLRYDGSGAGGSGQLHFYMKIGGSLRGVRVNNALTAGEWQFVAGAYDGNVMRLYRNGVQIGSLEVAGKVSGSDGLRLGDSGSEAFDGLLDEVALYPKALSSQEIAELYGSPVFHIPFDEASAATRFEDDSGFHNDATCTGSRCPASAAPGAIGNAVRLDGGDYVAVPSSPVLDLSNKDNGFTLSAWVYPEGNPPLSACPFVAEYFGNTTLQGSPTWRTCEGWPLERKVNSGQSSSQRWTGTFNFQEGNYSFEILMDEGFRLHLDNNTLADYWDRWTMFHGFLTVYIPAGLHTLKVEHHTVNNWSAYDMNVYLRVSPSPLPQAQGILGADNYPTLQRVGNRLRLVLNDATRFTTPNDVLTPNAWNHVVATFDGTTLRLYVDGALVSEVATPGQTAEAGRAFDIGRSTAVTRLELRTLNVIQTGGFGSDYRIRYSEGSGALQQVWKGDGLNKDAYPSVNVTRTFSSDVTISMYECDRAGFPPYPPCSPDAAGAHDMGSVTISAMSASPYETVSHFASKQGSNKADLLWYAATDAAPFQGKVDEVAIYPRVLAADDVQSLYDAGSVVLRLPLDDAPGATEFADALGQHNGACSDAACPTAGVPGRQELALLFDGVDDTVTVNDANAGDVQNLTVAAWVRLESLPSGIMRFVTVGDEKAVLRYQNGDLHFYLKTTDESFHGIQPTTTLQTDTWYHVAGTYDGQAMRLYLNGSEIASQPVTGTLVGGETVRLSYPTETLDGNLDEVVIYRRALSAGQVQALYRAAPELLLALDETEGATTFEDATGNGHAGACSGGHCPKTGVKGQIGLAADFDGANDFIEVPHSDRLNPGDDLTLAVWVKLTKADVNQKLIGKSTQSNGYVLGIQGGKLSPEIWNSSGTHYSASWGKITAGYWTHLAITWEKGGDLVGYINGVEVGRISAGSNPIGSNTNPLRVGIAPWNATSNPANGRLDHVTLFTRALSPLEIRAMFRLQAKWVEERQATEVTVDADAPSSTLVSDETYRPNRDAVLLVKAEDATTPVTLEEMGVSADGGAYGWSAAPACQDAQAGAAWCPTFEPTNGEGRYLLQFRATDNVGNRETPAQTHTILVDATPPHPATAIAQGQILRPQRDPSAETAWLVGLNGTANDPPVAGSPGSGAASVLVKLTDTDPVTDTLQIEAAALNGSAWQVDYRLLAADPTGTYTLTAQAADRVENTSEFVTLVTLGVDAAPPEASLDDITALTGVTGTITTTMQLTGRITETGVISIGVGGLRVGILPAAMESLSGTVAIFHLDDPAGATRFANDTGLGTATCSGAACPTANVAGIWGTAADFGEGDSLVADFVSQSITGSHGFSFGAWVYPKLDSDQVSAIFAFSAAGGNRRNQLLRWYNSSFCYSDPQVGDQCTGTEVFPDDRWYYLMVVITEEGDGTLFINRQPVKTFHTDVRPDPAGRFSMGHNTGKLDEVTVYDRALSPAEVGSVYADAALDSSGQGVISTGWQYTVPEGLDGLYQLNLRPADVFGNSARRADWPAWRGEIDTAAPAVKLTIAEKKETVDAGGYDVFTAKTTYTCWAQDFNLVDASAAHPEYDFQCPCDTLAPLATTITNTFYHQVSPWYAEVFSDTTRLYEHTATCRVPGLATENFMQACDAYGHCASQVAVVDQAYDWIPVVYSVVLTPTHQAILTATGSTTVEARAYARDRIKQVQIYDYGTLVGTKNVDLLCAGNITTTQWTQAWFASDGTHSLNSHVTPCTGQTEDSFPNSVQVDSVPPLVPTWPLTLNRQQRISYGRVALSGQASDAWPGSGVTRVEVNVDGGGWAEASLGGEDWRYEWYLGEEPDNAHYNVAVRATDRAGWSTAIAHPVTVDLDAPNPITLSLTSNVSAGGVVSAGLTLRQLPATLDLAWQASEPPAKLLNYQVLWTIDTPTQTLQIPAIVPPGGPLSATYRALFDAQRIQPSVTSVFTDGNKQVDDWGPVYVDTPLTPDFISMDGGPIGNRPYAGWLDSGCSAIGLDRRVQENAPGGVALDDPQNLYVTWNSEALRIAWTGANWDYSGDLFIYMDTLNDLTVPTTAFNPFTATQGTTLNIPGARAFIWVQNSQFATLGYWEDTGWQQRPLNSTQYRFDTGLKGGTTDLYIPFDLIGITDPATTPLVLYAFATDEGAMRLWTTMPPQNSLNSPRVVETTLYAGANQALQWLHVYSWPSLGPGVCPNNSTGLLPAYSDSDLRFELAAAPVGTTYGLLSSDLFWLAKDLTDPNRPVTLSQSFAFMDVDHPPVGDGDIITYTLSYANHGTQTATGVTVQASGLCALDLLDAVSGTLTIAVGDVLPGAAGSVTFFGRVDVADHVGGCHDWATVEAVIHDDAHGPGGNPLDWLWADHRVDNEPPGNLGISQPEALIGTGDNLLSGYVSDASEVPLVTLEAQAPAGGTRQTACPDATPADGQWSCTWNATTANGGAPPADGDLFLIRLQATDSHGLISDWSGWQPFIVDTVPPTVTFSAETTEVYSGTVMGGARLSFVGQTHDNRGAGQVEVCLRPEGEHSDDDCAWANVQLEGGQDGRWIRIVTNLEGQDNVTHTLRAYAVDLVGNRSQELTGLSARSGNRPLTRTFDNSASGLTFQLDNVAPVITVTAAITQLEAFPDRPLTTVLSGTVTDGGQVNRLYALVRTPGGDLLTGQIARNDSGGGWWYDLRPSAIGEYAIWVNAVDGADNAATFGPHYLQVTCRSADLTATIVNAETAVGASSPISFTARVSNNGGDEVPAGLPVAFYANDSLIGTAVTTRALNTGESEELTVIWAVDTPGDYEITIVVNDDGAGARPVALCSAPSETQQTISILDVPLGERWNLVSSYVNPSNTDTEAVQRPISGTYVTIQSFDQGARSYYPDLPPGFNNLTDMDAEHGYWIKARDGISPTLRIVGQAFAEDRPLGLDAGWNLVSYLPRASKLVTEALQSIAGKYTVVLGFDRGALSFYPDLPPEINTLRTLDPLYGYWIKTTQTVTLQYSTTVEVGSWKLEVGEGTRLQSPISNLQSPISNTRQVERAAGVSPTNTWVNFYGPARQSDDTLLPVGTMVLAVDPGGVTCGAAAVIYEGQYGLLACYGDDPDTPADEGGRRGDAIRLMVAGKVLGAGVWTAYGERQRISLGKDDRQYRFLPLLPYGDRSPAGNEQGPAAPPARRWLPLIPQGTGSTGGAITPSGNRTFYLPLAPWRVPADDGRESRIEPLPAWRAVLSRLWDGIQRRFAVLPANSVPAPVAMR